MHEYAAAVCRDFLVTPLEATGRLLKFAGCIHIHKILRGNIFGLIFKNKMAAMGVFQLSTRSIVGPVEQRVS